MRLGRPVRTTRSPFAVLSPHFSRKRHSETTHPTHTTCAVSGINLFMNLFVVGVSHKTAPVQLREQLAVNTPDLVNRARQVKRTQHLDEVVVLSTCNRVEIYGASSRPSIPTSSLLKLSDEEVASVNAALARSLAQLQVKRRYQK